MVSLSALALATGQRQRQVDAVAAGGGQRPGADAAGKVGSERAALGDGGEELIAGIAVERGVDPEARRDEVGDAQALRAALGQGDDDVEQHRLADDELAARGVRGARIVVGQRAAGVALGDDR